MYITNNKPNFPVGIDCTNVTFNPSNTIILLNRTQLVNWLNATVNMEAVIVGNSDIYKKLAQGTKDYWSNLTENLSYRTRFDLPNVTTNLKKYLTLNLGGISSDLNDTARSFRFSPLGIKSTIDNNFYNWFSATTVKSVNNMIDGDCQNMNYTSNACNLKYTSNSATNNFKFNKSSLNCEIPISNNNCPVINSIQTLYDINNDNCYIPLNEGDTRFCDVGMKYSQSLKSCYNNLCTNGTTYNKNTGLCDFGDNSVCTNSGGTWNGSSCSIGNNYPATTVYTREPPTGEYGFTLSGSTMIYNWFDDYQNENSHIFFGGTNFLTTSAGIINGSFSYNGYTYYRGTFQNVISSYGVYRIKNTPDYTCQLGGNLSGTTCINISYVAPSCQNGYINDGYGRCAISPISTNNIMLGTIYGDVYTKSILPLTNMNYDSYSNKFITSLNNLTNTNLSLGDNNTLPLPNNNVMLNYNYTNDTIYYTPSNLTCLNSSMYHDIKLQTPLYPYNDGNCYSDLGKGCYDAGFSTTQSKTWN